MRSSTHRLLTLPWLRWSSRERWLSFLVVTACLLLAERPAVSRDHLTLAVHPYLIAADLMARFQPLADYLGKAAGVTVTVEISDSYQTHLQKLGSAKADLGFIGPGAYVRLSKRYGPQHILARLSRSGRADYTGYIVTRRGGRIGSLQDLRGRTMAFGDPNSTMGYLVPRHLLVAAGLDLPDLGAYTFVPSHEDIALGVLMGEFDAGAISDDVYEKYRDQGLRVLENTPRIAEHLFIAGPTVLDERVEKLRQALLRLHQSPEGAHILQAIKVGVTEMVPAHDGDYWKIRRMLNELRRRGLEP